MIQQTIASVGPYADLWSHLKSMEHALRRVKSAQDMSDIADLDKARLLALAEFIKRELATKASPNTIFSESFFSSRKPTDFSYSLDVDLRAILRELPEFHKWSKSLSFDQKCTRLVKDLEDYSSQFTKGLFPEQFPKEEFEILEKLLTYLLLQTESGVAM